MPPSTPPRGGAITRIIASAEEAPLFRTAISPYHLTTREAPAMAALLLGERSVTLLPSPTGPAPSYDDVRAAANAVPAYLEFMHSWQWSMALWREAVIAPGSGGEDAACDLAEVCAEIGAQDRLAPLRPLMRRDWLADRERYLQAVAGDVLRGGPDPAISVPLAAALDRFSARHGLVVVRSAASSLVQRMEHKLGARLATFAVPVLDQAEGDRLLEARQELQPELEALRAALSVAVRLAQAGVGEGDPALRDAQTSIAETAREYAGAFAAVQDQLTRIDDPDDDRVTQAVVSIMLVRLPTDAVLRSSVAAARAYLGASGPVAAVGAAGAKAATLPVRAPAGGCVVGALVKTVGRLAPEA